MRFLTIIVCFSILAGCKEEKKVSPVQTEQPDEVAETGPWASAINAGDSSLVTFYTDNALLLLPDGSYIQGASEIREYYNKQDYQIDRLATEYRVSTGPGEAFSYETGTFHTSDKRQFDYLLIRGIENEELKREMEFIAESQSMSKAPEVALRERRKLWMDLCNDHQVSTLVKEMYRENGVYYNHKPLIVGQRLITEEYGYMQSPNYHLELNPLHLNPVDDSLVIEIGEASGSYNGNYLLVWQKDDEGVWKILFDSNI